MMRQVLDVMAFQARPKSLTTLQVTVLRGRKISSGYWDYIRTAHAFVTLGLANALEEAEKTVAVEISSPPEWYETFEFFYDPSMEDNYLELKLWDAGCIWNKMIGGTSIPLSDVPHDKPVLRTLKFGRHECEVDIFLIASEQKSTNLRYSLELCEEEKAFLKQRRKVVFKAMKNLLGDRAPSNPDEAPVVALLGSGGGLRAAIGYCGGAKALEDMKMLDCVTYMAGLSGSAWYLSTLYAKQNGSIINASDTLLYLRDRVDRSNWSKREFLNKLVSFEELVMKKKRKNGQPTSLVDYYGFFMGDYLLGEEADVAKLSQQKFMINCGQSPLPIYPLIHVKSDVDARIYSEWIEQTPYETGMTKYGTFIKSELFGSKFFCGKVIREYPEPYLHYLQGLWGSNYAMLLSRRLGDEENLEDEKVKMLQKYQLERAEENADDYETRSDEETETETDDSDLSESVVIRHPIIKESSTQADNNAGTFKSVLKWILSHTSFLKTRIGAAIVFNFLWGQQPTTSQEATQNAECETMSERQILVVDAGLDLASPYPPLLRPQRGVDLFLSYEFNWRDTDEDLSFQNLKRTAEWAKTNNIRFPSINCDEQFKKYGLKECYVFQDLTDPACPIVMHFVLIKKTYRNFIEPEPFTVD